VPRVADRRTLRGVLPPALTAIVLALLAGFLWQSREHIAESFSLRPGYFVAVAALTVAILAVRGVANRLHFRSLGVNASTADWFRLVTVTAFTNYLPLSAGLVAKALFLKRVHDLPYQRFAVGQATLLLLVIATNGVIGLLLLLTVFPEHVFGVVGLGFAAMAGSGVLLALPEGVRERLRPTSFPLTASVDAGAPRSWPAVALCQVAMLLGTAVSLDLCFEMGESSVGLAACMVFSAATVLTRFVTIIPGALGVRELLIGGLAFLTGFDARDAVVASSLARSAEIVVVFALGAAFTFRLSGELAARSED
jgi:hypothetical protein